MRDAELDQVFKTLNEAWTAKPLGKETRAIWGAELRKHDFRPVMAVLRGLIVSSEWRPSLAQILKPLLADPEAKSAHAAFETVWNQIGKLDREVSELEQRAVDRLGGWPVLGMWEISQRQWHFKAFKEAYDDLLETGRKEHLAIGGQNRATHRSISSSRVHR